MYRKIIFLIFILVFVFISSANAKTIIWVSGNVDGDNNADLTNDWQEWIDKLESEGYTVDARPQYWDELTQAKVDELNAADLVIVSRALISGDMATNNAEVALWNSVTAPMINNSPYVIRGNRWKWVSSQDELPNTGDLGCPLMQVTKPSHPIFWGITLDSSDQIQVTDPEVGSGNCTYNPTNNVGNGTLIAKTVPTTLVQDWFWIAEWQEGVEFYPGSGTYAGSHRLYFSAGTHEVTGTYKASEFNFTDEGWKLYLNAVKYMLGELTNPRQA